MRIPTIRRKTLKQNMKRVIKVLNQLATAYEGQKAVRGFINSNAGKAVEIKQSLQSLHSKVKLHNFINVYKQFLVGELIENIAASGVFGETWKSLTPEEQEKISQEWQTIISNSYLVAHEQLVEKEL